MFSLARANPLLRTAASARILSQVVNKSIATPSISLIANLRAFSDDSNVGSVSGHVKWFDVKKGFGFITPVDGGDDVFVHQTVIHAEGFRSLGEGEEVFFDVEEDNTGRLRAQNVSGPEGAYVQGAPRREQTDDYDSY